MYAPKHGPQRPPRPPARPAPPPPHPSPHHTNSAPPTPRGLRANRHHQGPAPHRARAKSERPNGRRNDNHHNTTRPQGSRDAGHHLPGAEPYPAPRIRGRWAPSPNNPSASHTPTGSPQPLTPPVASAHGPRPATSQVAATKAHPEPRPHHSTPDRPAAGPVFAPPDGPPTQAHTATPTDTTTARSSNTVHPHTHGPTEGLIPQAPATSSAEDLPATTHDGPAAQRHHAPPTGPTARPAEPSSPDRPAPGPGPGPDPARSAAPASAPQPTGPESRPEAPPVAEGHARGATQPTNDEAELPALPTRPQRGEPTVGGEEMRGPPQRTPTPTPMGEPGGGADRPAMQSADPPDIAAHGGCEALTADQPDTEPEGPTPDTECEDCLHRPSATDRAGAAPLANLALRTDASMPGGVPPRDPPETRAGSETREATPDTPQRAADGKTSPSGHYRDDDSFDAFMEPCKSDPHTVPALATPRVHPEPRRDHAEDTPLTTSRQAHLQRDYTALGQVTAAGGGACDCERRGGPDHGRARRPRRGCARGSGHKHR